MRTGRVIILDLFGTILRDVSNEYEKGIDWLCGEILTVGTTFDSAKKVAEEYRRANMLNRTTTHREAILQKQLELFRERIGFRGDLPLLDIEYGFFTASRVTAIESGLIELLNYLKEKDFSVFVMSNTIFSAGTIMRLLEAHGIGQYFSGVFTSGDCGYRKPGKKFFDYVFKRIQEQVTVKCDEVIFVGNSLEKDMLGAKRFCFNRIWLSPDKGGFGEELADCARVENLLECRDYLESNFLSVAGISKHYSVSDGIGNRIVVYLQGCDLKCYGCHNQSTWNELEGRIMSVRKLVVEVSLLLSHKARNVTISDGEPLTQPKALQTLLMGFGRAGIDVCLYTGREFEDVPEEVRSKIHYLKTGRFIHTKKTTTKGFYGSINQQFLEKGVNGEWTKKDI
ncbi:MAG: 4Fe-4S cluster-binding domain-containing protein [Treponema sp.]|nr:4Fe-4S cluster-binding domain-containing protein [Treponema sp.]